MALPPENEAPPEGATESPPGIRLLEASEAHERRCVDCGKVTTAWKPVRRKGTAIILCTECAARPPQEDGGCPQCGAPLGPRDAFCGQCGARIEYACPKCGSTLDPDDTFCGKCGSRVV